MDEFELLSDDAFQTAGAGVNVGTRAILQKHSVTGTIVRQCTSSGDIHVSFPVQKGIPYAVEKNGLNVSVTHDQLSQTRNIIALAVHQSTQTYEGGSPVFSVPQVLKR
jgi:hypothetical protein